MPPSLLFRVLRMVYLHCVQEQHLNDTQGKLRGDPMKDVLFESQIDLENRKKNFSICSKTEDKVCRTQVQKSFAYVVDRADETMPAAKAPVVFIRKAFDSKKGIEEFGFHVRGFFHVNLNDTLMKVIFHHTLDIKIKWKTKNFSPKKSESLT